MTLVDNTKIYNNVKFTLLTKTSKNYEDQIKNNL